VAAPQGVRAPDMKAIFDTTILISTVLLGMLIPFFVFSATLLGAASKRIKEEEERAKEQDKTEFDEAIKTVQQELGKSQETGDIRELRGKLDELLENRQKNERHIAAIRKKYDRIKLHGIVIYPGSLFLVACILASGASAYLNGSYYLSSTLWIGSLLSLVEGIRRLCITLSSVQEIAVAADEYRLREQYRMTEQAFSQSLLAHEQKRQEKLIIQFPDITFPISVPTAQELTIPFRVALAQGKIVRAVDVWFYVPDGFQLLTPDTFWRQSKDFKLPDIRTVKVRLGDVSVGVRTRGHLKVKAPDSQGKYIIVYSLHGEGYRDKDEEFGVDVH